MLESQNIWGALREDSRYSTCRLKPIITWNNIYAEYVAIEWKPSNKLTSEEETEINVMQGNDEKLLNYSSRSGEKMSIMDLRQKGSERIKEKLFKALRRASFMQNLNWILNKFKPQNNFSSPP